MSDIKNLIVLSKWLEFELETKQLDPPIVKLRVVPMIEDTPISTIGVEKDITLGGILASKLLDVVKEWDFTLNDKPLPVTQRNKEDVLLKLLGLRIKGTKTLFGMELLRQATDPENFAKN